MDKLRALQYFVASAQAGSLSGAARHLGVSVPAVLKLVNALERDLGASLFERTSHGLTLTTDGQGYLEACHPLLEQLAAADESVSGAASRPRGTLVVGAPTVLSQHCLVPELPRFHARYPDIAIDLRVVNRPTDSEASTVDLLILLGWPEHPDLVRRRIGQTRLMICASPAYWAAHGVPQRPADLAQHTCLLFRGPEGAVLDLWRYERAGVSESIAVTGWLVSSHRDALLDAVLAGEGVGRFTDITVREHLRSGRLVPALLDWETKDGPPVHLLYRAGHKRTPRVRLFVDFATRLFAQLDAQRDEGVAARLSAERPQWYRRAYSRASAVARR